MRPSVLPVLAAILLIAGMAVADPPTPVTHYRWTDATGLVHYSDTIPSSALAGGYDIVNNDGRVVRHVAPQLTAAQRKAVAVAAARVAQAKRIAHRRSIQDAQLLAAYPNARALEADQQAQLKQTQSRITTIETNLHSQEDSLTDLLAQAADLEHDKKPIPAGLRKRIASQRQAVNNERGALVLQRADLARTQNKFKTRLEHYRALRAKFGASDDPVQP